MTTSDELQLITPGKRSPPKTSQSPRGWRNTDQTCDPRLLQDDIIQPLPFLQHWHRWYLDCCVRKQPMLSLLSAITAVSAIMGQSYRGPLDCPMSQYIIALAPTGAGKEQPRQMGQALLRALGLEDAIGSDSWRSANGMAEELAERQTVIWYYDEFHVYVAMACRQDVPVHVKQMGAVLLSSYMGTQINGSCIAGKSHANAVRSPRINLYATSSPHTFWSYMTPGMLDDGLIGRCIILNGLQLEDIDNDPKTTVAADCLPQEILDHCRGGLETNAATQSLVAKIMAKHAQVGGQITQKKLNNAKIIGFKDQASSDHWVVMRKKYSEAWRAANLACESEVASITTRTMEKVARLASVYAWMESSTDPKISVQAIEWAHTIVTHSNLYIMRAFNHNVTDGRFEKLRRKVTEMIQMSNQEGIALTSLMRRIRVPTHEMQDVVNSLIAGDMICVTQAEGRGRVLLWKTAVAE